MESILNDLEASQDIPRIYRSYENSNTSDVNLILGTDASGIIDIEETLYHKEELTVSSLKSYKESNLHKDSSLTKPELIYFPKILSDRVDFDSLQSDMTSKRFSLKFSEEVENLIIYNSIFRKFISQVEIGLNDFFEQENLIFENNIFFEEDWEIPDYKKLVLSLNFKGISFEQEILLWKMINDIIYYRINSMILANSEEDTKKIKELKKEFFIKLEM